MVYKQHLTVLNKYKYNFMSIKALKVSYTLIYARKN